MLDYHLWPRDLLRGPWVASSLRSSVLASTRRTTVAMHNGDLSLRDVRDILKQAKPSRKAFLEAAPKCPSPQAPPTPPSYRSPQPSPHFSQRAFCNLG